MARWPGRRGPAGREARDRRPRLAVPPPRVFALAIVFPDCWDGERVDSADHRSHVATSDGACPDTHPVPIPQLELVIDYGPVEPVGLSLSSGPVSSAHADFWNTWDQDKLETEVELCLRLEQVCAVSSG